MASDNTLILDNGAEMSNVGAVSVGRFNSRHAWGNGLVVTNGASFSSGGEVNIAYPHNDSNRVGFGNFAYVAGGPLGNATWNMNNAHLFIGNNRSSNSFHAWSNRFTVATGGVVTGINNIEVGRQTFANTIDNALVLAGGEMEAVSLTVWPQNRLDVVVGPEGVKPVVLTGAATFGANTFLDAKTSGRPKFGIHDIIRAPNTTISTNNITFRPPNDPNSWKLLLRDNNSTLSISVSPPATLFMVK